jgi:hypothetical protein
LLFGGFISIKSINSEQNINSKFCEFTNGLKRKRVASAFNLILIIRRLVLVFWLICFQWLPVIAFIPFVGFYQICHTIITILILPYDHQKENIVEIYNEIIFTTVVLGMNYLTEKERWNGVIVDTYIYLMMTPGIFILLTSLCKPF